MKVFRHFDAGSVEEALALLTEFSGNAMVTAEGLTCLAFSNPKFYRNTQRR